MSTENIKSKNVSEKKESIQYKLVPAEKQVHHQSNTKNFQGNFNPPSQQFVQSNLYGTHYYMNQPFQFGGTPYYQPYAQNYTTPPYQRSPKYNPLIDPTNANSSLPPSKELVKKQIEFYFSEFNLGKDYYLRNQMDINGFVSVKIISEFPRLKNALVSENAIIEASKESDEIEENNKYLRSKKSWWKFISPSLSDEPENTPENSKPEMKDPNSANNNYGKSGSNYKNKTNPPIPNFVPEYYQYIPPTQQYFPNFFQGPLITIPNAGNFATTAKNNLIPESDYSKRGYRNYGGYRKNNNRNYSTRQNNKGGYNKSRHYRYRTGKNNNTKKKNEGNYQNSPSRSREEYTGNIDKKKAEESIIQDMSNLSIKHGEKKTEKGKKEIIEKKNELNGKEKIEEVSENKKI